MSRLPASLQTVVTALRQLPVEQPEFYAWYALILRFLFPILAILMLVRIIRSLVKVSPKPEVWAYLSLPNGSSEPLTHWENILGRGAASDVVLNYPVVSRQHAALIRSGEDRWTVHDLNSKSGTYINGKRVENPGISMTFGDVLSLGGVDTVLLPVSDQEAARRRQTGQKPVSPWGSFILLTVLQLLTALQFLFSTDEEHVLLVPAAFLCLCLVMWLYSLTLRALGRTGFEMETIAFFLSTLSLAVTASSAPDSVPKQLLAVFLGLLLFLTVGVFLRDLDRVRKIRWLMAAGAIFLLSLSLVLGHVKYGAANWISLFGFSFQPSELAKICYIFAGAATLERLFRRRNLGLFILLTGVCMGCLAIMSDFGTAAIFFVTFLVIAYLRSGDYATLSLICGGAVFGGLVLVTLKPYILRRFAAWGHAWEQASDGGFQQTRTMSAAASGGLIGVGPGEGWLHRIPAADTDLVFGMLCEEWGLIIAVLSVVCIAALAVFAVRSCRAGRSSFYTIAACAATSLLVFQTALNVLGSVDILPLTGVTFPFVSNGGSSMLASWGLLAFLKAADTRNNASFAIQLQREHGEKWLGNLLSKQPKDAGKEVHREKIEKRTLVCLVLTLLLLLGVALFVIRFFLDGGDWASFASNRHLYNSQGQLSVGRVLDRDGDLLSWVDENGNRQYYANSTVRMATLHAVGDPNGAIGTSALVAFADQLSGYNFLTGADNPFGQGNDLYLTLDAHLNYVAYQALSGRRGAVGVYNYVTGEVLCMVSTPAFDPADPPNIQEEDERYEGVYVNRFLSSTFTPGSSFKTVTLTAAIENLPDLLERTFTCTGSTAVGDETITCPSAHGTMDIGGAFANSCNGVFAQLAAELGADTMTRYVEKAGLLDRYSVNGIQTAQGSYDLIGATQGQLGWSGVGQYNDLVNPCAMMVWMGGIANGGRAAVPHLIQEVDGGLPQISLPFGKETGTLIQSGTARILADMMAQNVVQTYGSDRFPNMDICAKSGTAEVGGDKQPNAWFVGFLRNENAPYAFAVVVEEGGSGASTAGGVAAQVLNVLVNGD